MSSLAWPKPKLKFNLEDNVGAVLLWLAALSTHVCHVHVTHM